MAYVAVGFEGKTVEEVTLQFTEHFGLATLREPSWGIHLSIDDYTQEYLFSREFMASRGLEETDPFLKAFDILPFATELQLSHMRGRLGCAILAEVMGDTVARILSKRLGTRALVRIGDGEVPFRLYSRGDIEADFAEAYRPSFRESPWLPASLVP